MKIASFSEEFINKCIISSENNNAINDSKTIKNITAFVTVKISFFNFLISLFP